MQALILAAALAAAGAGVASTSEVSLVGEASEVQGCKRLGEVQSSSLLTGLFASKGRKQAIAQLKGRAAALGGTHVQVLSANFGYASNSMLGVAYRCPAPKPTGSE